MTKSTFFSTAIAALMLAACGSADYSKTESGIAYKIVEKGKGPQAKVGQFLKLHYTQKLNDSLLGTSIGSMPAFAKVDSLGPVYNAAEIFRLLSKGDSVVVMQEVDSLVKQNPMLPPFMKKGDKLYVIFKVEDIFDTEAQVQAEQEKEMQGQQKRDQAELDAYIQKNNIKATKLDRGTYVVVENPGTGAPADSGKYISVKYRGKLLSTGKEFESNMEAGKPPISFVLGQGQVIPGWDAGLKLFGKGGKGTLYIPGFQAYGMRPGPGGKPNEALVFDVEMVDIAAEAPAPQQNPMMQPVDPAAAQQGHSKDDGHNH